MRTQILTAIFALLLIAGCSKNDTVINFNCKVNGSAVNGNAVTYYNSSQSTFQVTMNGPNNQAITIVWYNINSLSGISGISARSYTIPAITLPPNTVSGTYSSQFGAAIYNTGQGNNLGGNVTITSNTGPGGQISGTFNFNALNQYNSADTAYIASGTFSNVTVVSN